MEKLIPITYVVRVVFIFLRKKSEFANYKRYDVYHLDKMALYSWVLRTQNEVIMST